MIYMFLALSVAGSATGEEILKNFQNFFKWLITWCLKTILYIFTGYMGITGVVSGTTDAATLKATKLTMSGMIPVVGGILADASESVIVGAGVMKNAVGVYGLLAFVAIFISPFLKIGVQYLLLKLTASVCDMFGVKRVSSLIHQFSVAMGLLLGMTGAVCILMLISTVCFMKGVG
jgi:stage III sporulation protein AE